MSMYPVFPGEIWLLVVDGLKLPELHYLSLSCKSLRQLCEKKLQVGIDRCNQYRYIKGPREYVEDARYHKLLLEILRGDLPPSFVEEIEPDTLFYIDWPEKTYGLVWGRAGWSVEPLPPPARYKRDLRDMDSEFPFEDRDKKLVTAAIGDCPWILECERGEFLRDINYGNEERTLALLLTLLPNLRSFVVTESMTTIGKIVRRIAAATVQDQSQPGAVAPDGIPLQKLLLVNFHRVAGVMHDLEAIVPFAALPSVRRILGHDFDYRKSFSGWPATLPLSKASEVIFRDSDIDPDAIRAFAKGFQGPCIFKQRAFGGSGYRENYYSKVAWDHYRISAADDRPAASDHHGTRVGTIEARFKDSNHRYEGYTHACVLKQCWPLSEYRKDMVAFADGSLYDWRSVADD